MSSRSVPLPTSGHQRRDRVAFFEGHARRAQPLAHLLDLAEPNANPRPAELDGEAHLADIHAASHVVCLDFFGAAAFDAGRFVRHARIGKRPPHDARPHELVGLESGRRADVRLRIESHPHRLEHLPHESYQGRIQMLLAEPVKAGVALHALVAIHRGAADRGIDIDSSHRTHVRAVSASHAFVRIDLHSDIPLRVLNGRPAWVDAAHQPGR